MAYSFRDARGVIMSFRGLGTKAQRRVRVRREALEVARGDEAAELALARALAIECGDLCRRLEAGAGTAAEIRRALTLGAITNAQAEALRTTGEAVAPVPEALTLDQRLSLEALANAHPSTARERERSPADYRRHMADLERFAEFARVRDLRDLSLGAVQRWIGHMREGEGLSAETRRHRLMYLRRATRMGAAEGVPDLLAGLRLDSPNQQQEREVSTVPADRLARTVVAVRDSGDAAALAVLALGAGLGLRPSEILRAQVGDIEGDVIAVGKRVRKNSASRRDLPIPGVVASWLEPATKGRSPEEFIVSRHDGRPWERTDAARWFRRLLAELGMPAIQIRDLRKTFATLAVRDWQVPPSAVEDFLGHSRSGLSAITTRHYLAQARTEELRPVTAKMDRKWRDLLQAACYKGRKKSKHAKKTQQNKGNGPSRPHA